MRVARSAAMLVAVAVAALGLASTASAAPCAGSGVAVAPGGALVRFATATRTSTQTLQLPSTDVPGLVLSSDGGTAYAVDHSFAGNASVFVIDTATMTRTATIVLGSIPATGMGFTSSAALSPDGTRLYVGYGDGGATRIGIVSTATNAVLSSYALAVNEDVKDLAVSADGTTLYLAQTSGLRSVVAADGSNPQLLSAAGYDATRIALSPDRSTRYVLGYANQSVLVQRGTATATTLATLPGRGLSLAIAPDGATLYAGVEGTGAAALHAINATSGATTAIGPTTATFGAIATAVAPDGGAVYAGSSSGLAAVTPAGAAVGAVGGITGAVTAAAICPAIAPDAPTAVVGDPGDTLVDVSWTAPAGTGGAAITGYTVTASPGGATCTTTGATACAVTGLRNATAYTFTVTARNVAGTSAASKASSRVTPRRDNRARTLTLGPTTVTFTKKGVGVAFSVTTTGPGVIAAAMTFKGDRYCTLSRRVAAAGTYRVRCVMAAAGRSLARRRSVTYALVATFSPTNGPLASGRANVVVPRRR